MIFLIIIVLLIVAMSILRNYRAPAIDNFASSKDTYRRVYPLVLYVYDKLKKRCHIDIKLGTREQLKTLRQTDYDEFVAKKGAKAVVLLFAICILACFFELSYYKDRILDGYKIARPGVGDSESEYSLTANIQGKDYQINATVSPKELTLEQVGEYFQKGYEEILLEMVGDNESLDKVHSNMQLPTVCQNGIISVSWDTSDSALISVYGEVLNEELENSQEVVLTVTLQYEKYFATYDIYVTVYPRELTAEDKILEELNEEIQKADSNQIYTDTLILPDKLGEEEITYSENKRNYAWIIFILGILSIIAFILLPDTELNNKLEKRKEQMRLDYSEIVSKLGLLVGAGMSLRRAWEKIVTDYKKTGRHRYAYDEMEITYNRMESGFSEIDCYEEFAKRCKLAEYTKLVALLTQNVRRGNEGLLAKLSLEMNAAFEQRKNVARKLGEEASTKLILPMIIMLLIVIVIVVIPVFMSM